MVRGSAASNGCRRRSDEISGGERIRWGIVHFAVAQHTRCTRYSTLNMVLFQKRKLMFKYTIKCAYVIDTNKWQCFQELQGGPGPEKSLNHLNNKYMAKWLIPFLLKKYDNLQQGNH